ncbi:hypothetical protein BK669_00535 [Pseudomonas fluorescens]|nr:hypothetical protein BK669_00535 [Pseudomonas fluorescens]
MGAIYLYDIAGALEGPAILAEIPGLGMQMPSNAVELPAELKDPADGCVWALMDGEVLQMPDHRGAVYRTDDGTQVQHTVLGPLPEGLADTPKPSPAHHWQDGKWVQSAAYLHARKTAEINRACELSITGGFTSSALGAAHQYDSAIDDQLYLISVMQGGEGSLYPCRVGAGAKEFQQHSAAQVRQLGDDFNQFRLTRLQQANALKARLDQALAAGDTATIEAVIWEEPGL